MAPVRCRSLLLLAIYSTYCVANTEDFLKENGYIATKLLSVTRKDIEKCHTCMIGTGGVQRIILVSTSPDSLTYLVRSQATLNEHMLIYCAQRHICYFVVSNYAAPKRMSDRELSLFMISSRMQENRDKGNLMTGSSQKSGDRYQYLEMMYDEELHTVDPLRAWKHRIRHTMPTVSSITDLIGFNKFAFQKLILKERAEKKNQRDDESSQSQRVCFLCSKKRAKFKCAKCLSFFSTSSGVRTYSIVLRSDSFHDLIAFSSTHNSQDIKRICQGVYCTPLYVLSGDSCRYLDVVFPQHQKHLYMLGETLKTASVKQKFDERNKATHPNDDFEAYAQNYLNSPYTGTEFIESTSGELESDYSDQEENSHFVLPQFKRIEASFQSHEPYVCVKVLLRLAKRRSCLHCVAQNVGSVVLLTDESYTESTLLVPKDSFEKSSLSDCNKINYCIAIVKSEKKICGEYLKQHAMNPTFYPELVTMKSSRISSEMCILVYEKQYVSTKNSKFCTNCILSVEIPKLKWNITPTSSEKWLLWVRNIDQVEHGILTEQIARCQINSTCTRVERMPTTICAQHIKYPESASENMVDFSVKRITGELWPPTYPVHPDPYDFENRAILLVRFMAADAAACIRCLVLQSEVFFAFFDVKAPQYGYVWMTQNHDNIIRICRTAYCQKLWFHHGDTPLKPGDMLPLCAADIPEFFPSAKRKEKSPRS